MTWRCDKIWLYQHGVASFEVCRKCNSVTITKQLKIHENTLEKSFLYTLMKMFAITLSLKFKEIGANLKNQETVT